MNKSPEEHEINSQMTDDVLKMIGAVNYGWSELDHFSTAALEVVTKLDGTECAILVGRLETIPKLLKTAQILKYRGQAAKSGKITQLCSKLSKFKTIRNAMTHGVFQGQIATGEMFWAIPAEILFEEKKHARALEVVSVKDILEYARLLIEARKVITGLFGNEVLNAAQRSLSHLRSRSHQQPNQDTKKKKPRPPPRNPRT